MNYVTYAADGALTGSYCQALRADHAQAHIEVTPEQRVNWTGYRANAARTGLELAPPIPAAPAVPQAVTMLNARTALYLAGWLAPWEDLLAAMTGPEGDLARIKWAAAKTVRRDDPLVLLAIAALNKTAADADALFVSAGAL